MYRKFSIRNFRGIQALDIPEMERVVILAGANNTGKTSVLEALFVHSACGNADILLRVDAFRGLPQVIGAATADPPWHAVFHGFHAGRAIELSGTLADGRHARLTVRTEAPGAIRWPVPGAEQRTPPHPGYPTSLPNYLRHMLVLERAVDGEEIATFTLNVVPGGLSFEPAPPPPLLPALFQYTRHALSHGEVAERYSVLEVDGRAEHIENALRVIEPRLRKLAVVVIGGVPSLYGDIGQGRMVPLALMGEGVARLAAIVIGIAFSRDGVVLVDEVENGFHYSVLQNVWRVIAETARAVGAQVVATTHSFECIRGAYQAYDEAGWRDLRVIRLERNGNEHRAIIYDFDRLGKALALGFEVR